MTTTDWIIDISLICIVLRQIREGRLDRMFLAFPLALCAWTAVSYLRTIPTDGNDLVLICGLGTVGALLGLGSGAATKVRVRDGAAYAQAGLLAAVLWVGGVGCRLAFQLYATNGGADEVARFSQAHAITSAQAWVAALVVMALAEVGARLVLIVVRGRLGVARAARTTAAVTSPTTVPAATSALTAA